jgi:hypothetical protein
VVRGGTNQLRIPSPALVEKLLRVIVSFVFGIIIGFIIYLYLNGQMIEKLYLENRQLGITNTKLAEDIESLQDDKNELSKRNQQKPIIKQIEIEIISKTDEASEGFTETEINERLRKDLKFLVNQPLDSVADTAETIRQLVNGRKYDINQQQFGLNLETLIIHTTLTVKVTFHKIK